MSLLIYWSKKKKCLKRYNTVKPRELKTKPYKMIFT